MPKNPDNINHFIVFLERFLKLLKPAKKRIIPEMIIRKEPNCNGLSPINAFLIKINELPHIKDRQIKKIHFKFFDFI